MFTLGEQLYRPTLRDEETLLVEPLFRGSGLRTLGAATTTEDVDMPIPIDRCLFLHTINYTLNSAALNIWSSLALQIFGPQGQSLGVIWRVSAPAATGLLGDNAATPGGSTDQIAINRTFQLLMPPGVAFLRSTVFRAPATNPVGYSMSLSAYTIPPGRIGRA